MEISGSRGAHEFSEEVVWFILWFKVLNGLFFCFVPICFSRLGSFLLDLLILGIDLSSDIWVDLRERFSQGDLCRISDLQKEIYAFKQDDKTVTDYFTELKILWDELLQFRPLPSCSCPTPCSCGAVATARSYHNQDYVIRFLKGLNDSFSAVRSQILLMDPLPSINKAFSKVIQQERQFTIASPKSFVSNTVRSASDSFRKSSTSSSSSSTIDKRWCTFCQRPRHTIDTCYRKNGYPNGAKPRAPISRAHNIISDDLDDSMEDSKSVVPGDFSHGSSSGVNLTQEQYDQLLVLLQSSSMATKPTTPSPSHVTNHVMKDPTSAYSLATTDGNTFSHSSCIKFSYWIVDTGATDHITHSLSSFTFYKRIKPIFVTLPNGSKVAAHFSGTVIFNDHLCLTDGLPSWRMIGTAKAQHGLYTMDNPVQHFIFPQHPVTAVSTSSPDLWHHHLGHISDSRLKLLTDSIPSLTLFDNSACKTCHFAKHKKLSFPVSQTRSNNIFDLIHVDIWGPNSIVSLHGHRYFLTIVDDFTRYTWIILLKTKSEVRGHIQNFFALANTQYSKTIKILRSDNGKEFDMPSFYAS
ncbi:uncharacterized protein LOC128032616 [Gossypium raimondii]|uniref:uncharacterized protein LOC128032616 n=1 Tax=Gossypium raimondii TaxID=29730 RepID=UPI00227BC731|nr:uncharacterized protein LOC128032616 [Gossypium raimondii]